MFGGIFIVTLNTQIIFPELPVRGFMNIEANFFILVDTYHCTQVTVTKI